MASGLALPALAAALAAQLMAGMPGVLSQATERAGAGAAFLSEYAALVRPRIRATSSTVGATPDAPVEVSWADGPLVAEGADDAAWDAAGAETQGLLDKGACVRLYGLDLYAVHRNEPLGATFLERPRYVRVSGALYEYADEARVPRQTALGIARYFACREGDGRSLGLQVCEGDELLLMRYVAAA